MMAALIHSSDEANKENLLSSALLPAAEGSGKCLCPRSNTDIIPPSPHCSTTTLHEPGNTYETHIASSSAGVASKSLKTAYNECIRAARQAYDGRDFESALAAYQRAFAIFPSSEQLVKKIKQIKVSQSFSQSGSGGQLASVC